MENYPVPKDFLSVSGLGAPKRYFRVKSLHRVGYLVASIIFACGSISALIYGANKAYLASQKYGSAVLSNELTLPVSIALTLFVLGMASGWAARANWKRGIALFEEGFAVYNRKGIHSCRWEDVASLTAAVTRHYTNGIYTGTTHVYTLHTQRNECLVLNDVYREVEDLAKGIEESIFPFLYSRAAEQYNAGQTLTFGPVTIARGGIQIGKKTYPWNEVEKVSVLRGSLKLSKKDGGRSSSASAAASSIPNLRVLLAIIHQVVDLRD